MKKVNVFYHIYLVDNVDLIVNEQLDKLQKLKNVYPNIEIFINVDKSNSISSNFENLIFRLNNFTKNLSFCEQNLYELSTLMLLQNHALKHDGQYYLYVHTKGASRLTINEKKEIDYSYYENNYSYKNVQNWRHIMEHFCVENYKECLKELETNDLVGCNYIPAGKVCGFPAHYSGNFWWSKTDFIKKLPLIDKYIQGIQNIDRFYAEYWVGISNHNAVCLFPVPTPLLEKHNRCFSFTPNEEFSNNIIKQYFKNYEN